MDQTGPVGRGGRDGGCEEGNVRVRIWFLVSVCEGEVQREGRREDGKVVIRRGRERER